VTELLQRPPHPSSPAYHIDQASSSSQHHGVSDGSEDIDALLEKILHLDLK